MDTVPVHPKQSLGRAQSFWQRSGVVTTLHVVAVLVGIAGSLTALVVTGVITLFAACSYSATGLLCTNLSGLVPVLEWAIVILATSAPLTGAIISCRRGQWPWLPAGLITGAAMVGLAVLVSSGQVYML